MGGAPFEREPAAERSGARPAAAVVQPAALVEWGAGKELIELGRRRGGQYTVLRILTARSTSETGSASKSLSSSIVATWARRSG